MRRGFFWGTLLIVLGVLLTLQNLGLIQTDIWDLFWPIVLIIWGLSAVSGRLQGAWSRPGRRAAAEPQPVAIGRDGATKAQILLEPGSCRLQLGPGAAPDLVLSGLVQGQLAYETERVGSVLAVAADEDRTGRPLPALSGRRPEPSWRLRLPREMPLSLVVVTGDETAELDLTELEVVSLRIVTGAGGARVRLPAGAGYTQAQVETGQGPVDLRLPAGVAARITIRRGEDRVTVPADRFPRQDEVYQSPDYDTAEHLLDLSIAAGAGPVRVR